MINLNNQQVLYWISDVFKGYTEMQHRCEVDQLKSYSSCFWYFSTICRRKRSEISSKSTIKTPERRRWRRSSVFIVNFEHISHLFLVFILLTLNKQMLAGLFLIFYNNKSCDIFLKNMSGKTLLKTIRKFTTCNYLKKILMICINALLSDKNLPTNKNLIHINIP